MIKAILFDFDGTLADSSEGIFYTATKTMEKLGYKGPWTEAQLRRFVGPPLRECFKIAFGLPDNLCDKAVEIYRPIYEETGKNGCKLYPNMLETIRILKSLGYKICLATNKTEDIALSVLNVLKVKDIFDVVHGSDAKRSIFKKETIELVAKDLGLTTSECLMVGDSPNDRDGAARAGASFVAVSWGFGYSKDDDFEGFDYIDRIEELPEYVQSLNKRSNTMIEKIETKNAPAAIGPYSQAVKVGNFIFASGQIPVDPATGAVVEGTTADQAKQCFKNIKAVLAEAGTDITKVVKATVFLKDMGDFVPVNEVYAEAFKDSPVLPARSAVQVAKLPKDVGVEIEVIAVL